MIRLHRLNKKEYYLNSDLILTIETVPDTLITLTTGEKLVVRESPAEICQQVDHKRQLRRQDFQESEEGSHEE